jgi:hypothetical protein
METSGGTWPPRSHFTATLTLTQPNTLVDATGRARITDFGLAVVTQNPDVTQSVLDGHGHTTRRTAPKILGEQGTHNGEADVSLLVKVTIEVHHR